MNKFASALAVLAISTAVSSAQQHQPEYVYVADESSTYEYVVNKGTGALAQVPGSPLALGATSIAVAPEGGFVFLGYNVGQNDHGILIARIERVTGMLTLIPGSPFATDLVPNSLTVSPNGHFLFVQSGSSIYTFTVDGVSGNITPAGVPVAGNGSPVVSPNNKFLYFGGSPFLSGFSIDPHTGALTSLNLQGAIGTTVLIRSDGLYVYAQPNSPTTIYEYAADPESGALTPILGGPFQGTGPYYGIMALDPTGRFFYAATAEFDSGTLCGYLINSQNGAIEAPVPGSPFALTSLVESFAVDHSGKFAYLLNSAAGISEFTINSASGTLISIPGQMPTLQSYIGAFAITAPAPPSNAALLSLAIQPASPIVSPALAATQQFTASGAYSNGGHQFLTGSVTWSSSNPAVATISNVPGQSGVATIVGPGRTEVEATLNGIITQTTLTVQKAALVSIAITPLAPAVQVGTAIQFVATGTYADGTTENLTHSVIWASSETTVAPIKPSGVAYGEAAGTTTISATSESISASTALTVTSKP